MQERHRNRDLYFRELAATCRKHFIPYILQHHEMKEGMAVLEIGCGDGGNLLPFAEIGCSTLGVDISEEKIVNARKSFESYGAKGEFVVHDIFKVGGLPQKFDIILCHDVFEHLDDKKRILAQMESYLKPDGIVFMSFPAWQMPFGGHQQICRSKVLSRLPFIHLLPAAAYRFILKSFREDQACIDELLSIKRTKVSIEMFERLVRESDLRIDDRQLWFINPHYETKFGLKPRRLNRFFSGFSYFRNYLSTSCFYILKK